MAKYTIKKVGKNALTKKGRPCGIYNIVKDGKLIEKDVFGKQLAKDLVALNKASDRVRASHRKNLEKLKDVM